MTDFSSAKNVPQEALTTIISSYVWDMSMHEYIALVAARACKCYVSAM